MLSVVFGAVCAIASLASWMGWWSGWVFLPTGRLPLTVLPGGIGFVLMGLALLLPEGGFLGVLADILVICGFLFMVLFAVSVFTISRWTQSEWFAAWMSRRYPGYRGKPVEG